MRAIFRLMVVAGLFAMECGDTQSAEVLERTSVSDSVSLPLSEVVLYSSGVGFFQRAGSVEGNASVELRFKADDINDLLKSMVVQDFSGGTVASVSYGSRDPLSKSLKSFSIDLTENPSLGQLLNQVRGEPVEIMRPGPVRGTILGVERKQQPSREGGPVDVEFLNLFTSEGLQTIEMSQIQRIRLLNQRVDRELTQALELLASSHDTQKKSVTIRFDGNGKRNVGVAYIAQTPVWKTSYRLVLNENEAPYLQGWAIVENTSDEDWHDVRLSLVSGRPISFTMDLYQPLYAQRPVVEPELYSSLRPQLYGEAMEMQDANLALARPAPPMMADSFALGAADRSLSRGGRSLALRKASVESAGAGPRGVTATSLQEGVSATAEGAESGELFQYNITAPVTLSRQQSAMLPIVSENVGGQKVSIYNETVNAKRPLHGFRLKNSTSLHLMQGPITVFDGDAYAGDARIDDLAPGQDRLISYAMDLGVEIEPQPGAGTQELLTATIQKGVMTLVRKAIDRKTYTVRNRDSKPRFVLIEHPLRSGWDLVQPKTVEERTRDVYRFAVTVEPDKTGKLNVEEERQISESIRLLSLNDGAIGFYLKSRELGSKVKAALERIVAMRNQISETTAERTRREQRIAEISQEQARIRENMARLDSSSELSVRYIKKLDEQETELDTLRREIEGLKANEAKRQTELNNYLLSLDLD